MDNGDIGIHPKKSITESVCVECETKFNDTSLKAVTICSICKRPVCDTHKQSKLAYIPDFKHTGKAIKEAQEIIRKQHECLQERGHPCLPYTLGFWKEFDLERELKRQRIRNHMDGFGYATDEEIEHLKVSHLMKQASYINERQKDAVRRQFTEEARKRADATRTYDNKFNYNFPIPAGIYLIDKYYNKLNNARTIGEVEKIVSDYRKQQRLKGKIEQSEQTEQHQQSEQPKKKHWWQ